MSDLAQPAPDPSPGLFERLGSMFRTYAIPKDSVPLPTPLHRDDRHCWSVELPPSWPGDEDGSSQLVLLEDGLPLGPGHTIHDDIRTLGRGRYSHWDGKLYFSTSDNTSPESNGRVYTIIPPPGSRDVAQAGAGSRVREGAEAEQVGDPVSVEWSLVDVEPETMAPHRGHAYSIATPATWASDQESFSTVMLLEDGQPLPAPHTTHDEVADLGEGRYTHWGHEIRFSTTDNSDPRVNGRRYAVARADAFLFTHLAQAPVLEEGHCWILDGMPTEWTADDTGVSRLRLLEDGRLLGPAHASHADIREKGGGLYCHWGRQLWFSTSDNSNPLDNGRTYTVVRLDEGD